MRARLIAPAALVCVIIAGVVLGVFLLAGGEEESAERPFGFADNSYQQGGVPPEASAELAAAAGATAQRFAVSWATVQCCGPTTFDWSVYDAAVAAMREHDLAPLPVLVGTPGWARPAGCLSSLCPPAPEHLADFAAFAAAAVERWHDPAEGAGLLGVQIWNEPNFVGGWPTEEGPDARAYARLFAESARAIDDVDDDLPLLVAGLDGRSGVSEPPQYLSIPDYLDAFLEALDPSVLDRQDALAAHAYAPRFTEIMGETRAVRDRLEPERRIMVTETGASSVTPTPDEERQAQQIEEILEDLDASDDIGGVFIYTLVDVESAAGAEGLGVVDEGLAPKPAYCAIAEHNGASPPTGCPD